MSRFSFASTNSQSVVQQHKIQAPLVKLLNHENVEVKNYALLTLQKLMVTNWYEFLVLPTWQI